MKWKKENNKDTFPGQRGEAEPEPEPEPEEGNEYGDGEEGEEKEVEEKKKVDPKEWFYGHLWFNGRKREKKRSHIVDGERREEGRERQLYDHGFISQQGKGKKHLTDIAGIIIYLFLPPNDALGIQMSYFVVLDVSFQYAFANITSGKGNGST